MNIYIAISIIITITLAIHLAGLILGVYFGSKLGIRVFAKDAIILAFRTIDANPDQFTHLKDEALPHGDHEEWIQQAINRNARRDVVMDEWKRERDRLHDAGIT